MTKKDVEEWTQELRNSYEKGAEASKCFTSRILIDEFLEDLKWLQKDFYNEDKHNRNDLIQKKWEAKKK